jgi:hypothetical protein
MYRQPRNVSTNQPHVALAVSTVMAGASAASWASNHAAWFTIAAAAVAILSGLAGFAFYCVSTYYKIKYAGRE